VSKLRSDLKWVVDTRAKESVVAQPSERRRIDRCDHVEDVTTAECKVGESEEGELAEPQGSRDPISRSDVPILPIPVASRRRR